MTYEELITEIGNNLREAEAWPGTVVQEQIDRCYAAVVATAMFLPLPRLTLSESVLTPAETPLKQAPFPANIFNIRQDQGIAFLEFDTGYRVLAESIPFQSVSRSAGNEWQDKTLFNVDDRSKIIWFINAETLTLHHAGYPVRPTTGNYTSTDVPLDSAAIESAIQLVVAHVSGTTVKNPAAAQFAILLNQLYSGVGGQSNG